MGSEDPTAASLHYSAFLKCETFLEFNTSADPLSRELAKNPLEVRDGHVAVPHSPGLGIEPDLEAIERYRVL